MSIEVLEAQATLMIFGAGHIALALAQMAPVVGMRMVVIDDRLEFLVPERFPAGSTLIHAPYDRETGKLEPVPLELSPSTFVLVATWGWDEPALAQTLITAPAPAYIGLISSRTKWRVIRERLLAQGISPADVDRVRAPAGLDLGAETPGEIALAILAEMLAVRKKAHAAAMSAHIPM